MFRLQLLYRNSNVLKQLRYWPKEGQNVSTQFIRTIANESRQNVHESKSTSNTTFKTKADIDCLRQLVKEQVSLYKIV